MRLPGGFDRRQSAEPGSEIGAVETVAGAGCVHRLRDDRRDKRPFSIHNDQSGFGSVLDHDFADAQRRQTIRAGACVLVSEKRLFVRECGECDIRDAHCLADRSLGGFPIGPELVPEIGIERDSRPGGAALPQDIEKVSRCSGNMMATEMPEK